MNEYLIEIYTTNEPGDGEWCYSISRDYRDANVQVEVAYGDGFTRCSDALIAAFHKRNSLTGKAS